MLTTSDSRSPTTSRSAMNHGPQSMVIAIAMIVGIGLTIYRIVSWIKRDVMRQCPPCKKNGCLDKIDDRVINKTRVLYTVYVGAGKETRQEPPNSGVPGIIVWLVRMNPLMITRAYTNHKRDSAVEATTDPSEKVSSGFPGHGRRLRPPRIYRAGRPHRRRPAAVYADNTVSDAKGRSQRSALDAMLKDASRGRIDVVMVWALDRLGHSLLDLLDTLGELEAAGAALIQHQQAIDTPTPAGRMVFRNCSPGGRPENF